MLLYFYAWKNMQTNHNHKIWHHKQIETNNQETKLKLSARIIPWCFLLPLLHLLDDQETYNLNLDENLIRFYFRLVEYCVCIWSTEWIRKYIHVFSNNCNVRTCSTNCKYRVEARAIINANHCIERLRHKAH